MKSFKVLLFIKPSCVNDVKLVLVEKKFLVPNFVLPLIGELRKGFFFSMDVRMNANKSKVSFESVFFSF